MATAGQISLETYLKTSYDPDVEYVDGELEDRHVGEYDHNMVQRAILFWFYAREKEWGIRSIQEQRTQVASTQVRLPDISIFSRDLPVQQVFTHPQLIAIEVLSPEDRHSRLDEKIQNYIGFGIPNIWVIDPKSRAGWDCSDANWVRREVFALPNSPIYLSLPELFCIVDRDQSD